MSENLLIRNDSHLNENQDNVHRVNFRLQRGILLGSLKCIEMFNNII